MPFYLNFFPFISGAILATALLNEKLSFLVFIGLIPFFIFLCNAERKAFVFLGGWSYGITFLGTLLLWLFDLLPLGWTGLSYTNALIFITFSWLLTSAILGFIFGLAALAIKPLLNIRYCILGLAVWIAAEYIASWVPTILWKGPESTIYQIALGPLGYALVGFPNLAILSSVGSIYILSAIIFLSNICSFILIHPLIEILHSNQPPVQKIVASKIQKYLTFFIFCSIVILGIIPSLPLSRHGENGHQSPSIRIAVISSNVPSISEISDEEKPRIAKALDSILTKLAGENADVIVFPESSRVTSQISDTRLRQLFHGADTVLIDNSFATSSTFLSSILVAQRLKNGQMLDSWEKRSLMMGGEYPPYILTLWAKIFGFQNQMEQYTKTLYAPGKSEERPIPVKNHSLGISLCTGIWTPRFFERQKQMGADILVNMSSDALFHNSHIYLAERLRLLKLNAIENHSYLIHAANGSPSFLINPNGEIVETIENPINAFYTYKIIAL